VKTSNLTYSDNLYNVYTWIIFPRYENILQNFGTFTTIIFQCRIWSYHSGGYEKFHSLRHGAVLSVGSSCDLFQAALLSDYSSLLKKEATYSFETSVAFSGIHSVDWSLHDLFTSCRIVSWRMPSSEILRRAALVITDVSEEPSASIIRVIRIGELGTLAVTSNRRTLRRNTEEGILHSHRRENLKSYTELSLDCESAFCWNWSSERAKFASGWYSCATSKIHEWDCSNRNLWHVWPASSRGTNHVAVGLVSAAAYPAASIT
jgi:hypothetical protein